MSYVGSWFTWKRGRLPKNNIRERLDCGVANKEWLSKFYFVTIRHLTFAISDHCPLLLQLNNESQIIRLRNFKFEA